LQICYTPFLTQMKIRLQFPFYAKSALILIGLYLLINVLYIAQSIIIPLIYATIMAIAISPAVNFWVRRKVNRTFSIGIAFTIALLIAVTIGILLFSQINLLSEARPQLNLKFQALLDQIIQWIAINFNISVEKINQWLANAKMELLNNSGAAIGVTLTTIGGVLSAIILTPVYIVLLLYYQPHLVLFIHKIFGASNDNQVSDMLSQIKKIIQNYLMGLFVECAIVAVLNAVGLMILGMDYAILLGVIAALLNVIPYLGAVVATALFMTIAIVTKSTIYILYVFILYSVIQFIDNNYIVPSVIGSKVKLNSLVCVFAVIVGSAIWGIPGMFLSIPLMAILKLIFDHVASLKPWGFLMGDTF
jgi:predicted PurR-regulated permease PerM